MPSTKPSPFVSTLASFNKVSLQRTLFWVPVLLLGSAALWALNEMVLSKLSVPQLLLWQAKNHVVAIAIAVLLVHIVGNTVSALNVAVTLRLAHEKEDPTAKGHTPLPLNWSLRAPLLALLALVVVQAFTAMVLFGSEHPYIAVECSSTILSTKISFCDGASSIVKDSVDMFYVKASVLAAFVLPLTRIYTLFLSKTVSAHLPPSLPRNFQVGDYIRDRFIEVNRLYHPSVPTFTPRLQKPADDSTKSAKAEA